MVYQIGDNFLIRTSQTGEKVKSITINACTLEATEQLRQLFGRACNTWDSAPKEIKQLHDYVVHGQLLQEYS